jgi:hypothetical protein
LPGLIFLKPEGARAHDVLLEPVRVLVEQRFLVVERVGIGERRQKRGRREFQVKDDRFRVGRLNLIDHRVVTAARADETVGRIDDLVPARRNIGCGQA